MLTLADRVKFIPLFILLILPPVSWGGQLTVDRIESMPNLPQPYLMRDWKSVAMGYDSLVFDLSRTGDHLPLVWINNNTVNYPHSSFGLHSYVGTFSSSNAEAINVIPAVVGATLAGIDKSDQNGQNWVLGCEEFFNRRPEENVYLNGPTAQSGDDWWYAVMPNVFFYQLNDLYPGTGDFDYQFTSVADQWLRAVETMGGTATPWKKASMNYRGWYLSTMTPHPRTDYKEPESAGSIAWLLYNAYVETGQAKYRMGAEWAMEFLSDFPNNAAYELQLPYGVYVAARMNAELGTSYDVPKMLDWCFDPVGNERYWGATLGNWGEYDCDGLIGEALNEGYAFVMNGFEMAAALVPMVRYDDRFASAIGKWVLNMANASRLFYSNYLPPENQDGENWSYEYDPNAYIAHEAMREIDLHSDATPFATGDATGGGWGETNFALYGSSHVGIMGGIIDTTNIPGILKLDLLKTDFYGKPAYPSFLLYNPYAADTTIAMDVGFEVVDIYDAVTNSILSSSVSGATDLPVPADAAVLAVLVPAGGTTTYEIEKYLVDGIVVDYSSDQIVNNYPPRIKAIASDSMTVVFGQKIDIYCTAKDRDNDQLEYTWIIEPDTVARDTTIYKWTAPDSEGVFTIYCYVSDGVAETVYDSVILTVVESINHAPKILDLTALRTVVLPGDSTVITCDASDPDGDDLVYTWWANGGTISGIDGIAVWHAPQEIGYYHVHCQVDDNRGGMATDSLGIVVPDSGGSQIGTPVAYYPFKGNAADESGLDNHGTVHGATLVADRFGNSASAYYFNGSTDNISVPVSTSLNFQNAISISFWLNPADLPTREAYPISHGSWENRWKISIGNKKIRWTVKSNTGTKDLDSQTTIATGNWYHVVGIYDGTNFDLYLDGALSAHSTFSGSISTTAIDLMIGQERPDVTGYSFNGVLDDIRIYDYAITATDVLHLYDEIVVIDDDQLSIPAHFALSRIYPNPFNPQTTIQYQIKTPGDVTLEIFDLRGRKVVTLVSQYQQTGYYSVTWDARNASSGIYFCRLQADGLIATKKFTRLK
ncbi:LamG-like jellyroll fold domain-containing protein [Candidatus Neomarinimicrobiota bacterium]